MKKRCFPITLILALAFPAMLLADTGSTKSSVLLRERPNKSAKILAGLQKGEPLTFTAIPDSPDWVMVKAHGKEGYILRDTLLVKKEETDPPVSDAAKAQPGATEKKEAPRVFEIIPEPSPEEVRLMAEKQQLEGQIKALEKQAAELQPMKDKVAKLQSQLEAMHSMFPYLSVIEAVEDKGEDVVLAGIGKAKLVTSGEKVIVRLDKAGISNGDKAMQRRAKERYLTGSGENTRAYYVMDAQSIRPEHQL